MKMQEAVESGKQFKRPVHYAWLFCDETLNGFIKFNLANDQPLANFDRNDILADDWEIKE
jgi:hypothetical protein